MYSTHLEAVDLSHHIDRVSVQCSGGGGASTGPEASLASAALPYPLDDAKPHTARGLTCINTLGWSRDGHATPYTVRARTFT